MRKTVNRGFSLTGHTEDTICLTVRIPQTNLVYIDPLLLPNLYLSGKHLNRRNWPTKGDFKHFVQDYEKLPSLSRMGCVCIKFHIDSGPRNKPIV